MKLGIDSPLSFLVIVGLMLLLVAVPQLGGGGIYRPALIFLGVCLLVLLLVSLPRIASWQRGRGRPTLSTVEVEALFLGAGVLIVDLREAAAFSTGHIRGCLHVPFDELPGRFKTPDPKATRDLVLVDETDKLSHLAYTLLAGRGFTGIYVMRGGMKAWRQANLPLTK